MYIVKMSIGKRLDEAMHRAGFKSQSALARKSGVTQPTVNRILKGVGKDNPDTSTIKKLADATGVSFDWLNEGKKNVVIQDEDIAAIVEMLGKLDARGRSRIRGKIESWIEAFRGNSDTEIEDRRNPLNFDRRSGTR